MIDQHSYQVLGRRVCCHRIIPEEVSLGQPFLQLLAVRPALSNPRSRGHVVVLSWMAADDVDVFWYGGDYLSDLNHFLQGLSSEEPTEWRDRLLGLGRLIAIQRAITDIEQLFDPQACHVWI